MMPKSIQDTDESRRLLREPSPYPMTSNAAWSERRQTTRTTLNSVVYINFDSDNGGIVLNVSEGGLCFHSVAPVEREGSIRFWFSEHKQKIEADGEIAWIDESRKTGGLRFSGLPAEGQEQIRNWISQPSVQLAVEKPPARSVPLPARPVPPATPYPDFSTVPHERHAGPGSPVFPAVHSSRSTDSSDLVAQDSAEVSEVSETSAMNLVDPRTGFSRGLATGILVSALLAVPFLLHSYRLELGESLIRLGERLASKSRAQTQTVTPAQKAAITPLQPTSATHKQIPVSPPEKVLLSPTANPAKPQQAKLDPSRPIVAGHAVTGGPPNKALVAATISSPPAISLPTNAVAPVSSVVPDKIGAVPADKPANNSDVHAEVIGKESAASSEAGYFEVGKFKNNLLADNVADRLNQLGFHASVAQKGHLWMNSYSVLVGPYGDDQNAEAARKDLLVHGFSPRAFEKGSRDFRFPLVVTLNGTQVPVGDYTISWESYSPDAVVKFTRNYDFVVTAEGKWMKSDAPYPLNAIVWRKGADGSATLLEIRFGGMSRVLVFRPKP
jgi:PilZ domain/SPOR domain